MGLLDFIFGESVALPPRISGLRLHESQNQVRRRMAEAEERKRREREQQAKETESRSEDRRSCSSIRFSIRTCEPSDQEDIRYSRLPAVRYKTVLRSPVSSEARADDALLRGFMASHPRGDGRRTPNLHAPVLSFAARLLVYVKEKCGGRAAVAYRRSGVSRKIYSKIVSDETKRVAKRTVLQFVIGLQLSRSEADLLLKSAGYAFSDSLPEDQVFLYCLENHIWNLRDVNVLLTSCSQPEIDLSLYY